MSLDSAARRRFNKARSQLGMATLRKEPEDAAEARRDMAAARIELAIERAAAEAPPLTQEQRARIVRMLGGDA